jgi:hypothetical protein
MLCTSLRALANTSGVLRIGVTHPTWACHRARLIDLVNMGMETDMQRGPISKVGILEVRSCFRVPHNRIQDQHHLDLCQTKGKDA